MPENGLRIRVTNGRSGGLQPVPHIIDFAQRGGLETLRTELSIEPPINSEDIATTLQLLVLDQEHITRNFAEWAKAYDIIVRMIMAYAVRDPNFRAHLGHEMERYFDRDTIRTLQLEKFVRIVFRHLYLYDCSAYSTQWEDSFDMEDCVRGFANLESKIDAIMDRSSQPVKEKALDTIFDITLEIARRAGRGSLHAELASRGIKFGISTLSNIPTSFLLHRHLESARETVRCLDRMIATYDHEEPGYKYYQAFATLENRWRREAMAA